MSLQSKYQQYLGRVSTDALAPTASLHYIPTGIAVTGPMAIAKHHAAQEQQFKKKENFLNVIQGANSICAEIETTLRFEGGGGAFLPGLDDNFLIDRMVTLPVVHIVTFDNDQKIQQVRLMWDQGCLLKSTEVIGARGKNWPVRDGKDQIKSTTAALETALATSIESTSISDERTGRRHSRGNGAYTGNSNRVLSPDSPDRESPTAKSIGPRASAKPPPRDLGELFVDRPENPRERSMSPTKGNPRKMGAGQHYSENRLFDSTPVDPYDPTSPEKITRKAHPMKYNHFEFAEEPLNIKSQEKASKHSSQWDFSDFSTPKHPKARRNPGQERHFGWSDDEEEARKPVVHREQKPHPRRDAETHFDLAKDATPRAAQPPRKDRMGLYEDHVNISDPRDPQASAGEKMPLGNITNTESKGHKKNFSNHWEMMDEIPAAERGQEEPKKMTEGKKKANKIMEANWSMYDEAPPAVQKHKGINIKGDGMGSRKTAEKGWWEFGDD